MITRKQSRIISILLSVLSVLTLCLIFSSNSQPAYARDNGSAGSGNITSGSATVWTVLRNKPGEKAWNQFMRIYNKNGNTMAKRLEFLDRYGAASGMKNFGDLCRRSDEIWYYGTGEWFNEGKGTNYASFLKPRDRTVDLLNWVKNKGGKAQWDRGDTTIVCSAAAFPGTPPPDTPPPPPVTRKECEIQDNLSVDPKDLKISAITEYEVRVRFEDQKAGFGFKNDNPGSGWKKVNGIVTPLGTWYRGEGIKEQKAMQKLLEEITKLRNKAAELNSQANSAMDSYYASRETDDYGNVSYNESYYYQAQNLQREADAKSALAEKKNAELQKRIKKFIERAKSESSKTTNSNMSIDWKGQSELLKRLAQGGVITVEVRTKNVRIYGKTATTEAEGSCISVVGGQDDIKVNDKALIGEGSRPDPERAKNKVTDDITKNNGGGGPNKGINTGGEYKDWQATEEGWILRNTWQIIHVNCNEKGVSDISQVKGVTLFSVEGLNGGNTKLSGTWRTPNYKKESHRPFGDPNNVKGLKETGFVYFYKQSKGCEIAIDCIDNPTTIDKSDVKNNVQNFNEIKGVKYLESEGLDKATHYGVQSTPKKPESADDSLTSFTNNKTRIKGNLFTFFRDNIYYTTRPDVWYPAPNENGRQVVMPVTKPSLFTRYFFDPEGTPLPKFVTARLVEVNASGDTPSIANTAEVKGDDFVVGGVLEKEFNYITWKASWASDDGKPYGVNIDWVQEPNIAVAIPGSTSDADDAATTTVNGQSMKDQAKVRVYCAMTLDVTKEKPKLDFPYYKEYDANQQTDPDAAEEYNKVEKNTFHTRFVRSTSGQNQ